MLQHQLGVPLPDRLVVHVLREFGTECRVDPLDIQNERVLVRVLRLLLLFNFSVPVHHVQL